MTWNVAIASRLYLDRETGKFGPGAVEANAFKLKPACGTIAEATTSLTERKRDPNNPLPGKSGIPAPTSCELAVQRWADTWIWLYSRHTD
jgi:hypothetical protein